jgi:hypothetical protein
MNLPLREGERERELDLLFCIGAQPSVFPNPPLSLALPAHPLSFYASLSIHLSLSSEEGPVNISLRGRERKRDGEERQGEIDVEDDEPARRWHPCCVQGDRYCRRR